MTTSKSILLVALSFIASISSMAAIDEPRRLLRLPNDADADRRILQSSSMSMATTESIDNVGHTTQVVNDIVSKLVEEGETIDPMLVELLVLAAVDVRTKNRQCTIMGGTIILRSASSFYSSSSPSTKLKSYRSSVEKPLRLARRRP